MPMARRFLARLVDHQIAAESKNQMT